MLNFISLCVNVQLDLFMSKVISEVKSNIIPVLNVKLYLSIECQTLSLYWMSNFISVL